MDLVPTTKGEAPLRYSSFLPPREVKIGDAALFAGTTPRAIRHYHEIGLLPEPVRGGDDRRRYGYDDMIRLLWIRRMADAGIALDDIRDAFADTSDGVDADSDLAGTLERLETTLAAQETELRRRRTAVQRMRIRGSRMGLLSDFVSSRLEGLPEGSLRQADLDSLLVIERIFGPLGAAVNASRYIAMATRPDLREESDRVDAAEAALDDSIAVDDPRVAQVAARRHAFELSLQVVIENGGLEQSELELFDSWDARQAAGAEVGDDADGEDGEDGEDVDGEGSGRKNSLSAFAATGKMPYDFSPARLRCLELAEEMAAEAASSTVA